MSRCPGFLFNLIAEKDTRSQDEKPHRHWKGSRICCRALVCGLLRITESVRFTDTIVPLSLNIPANNCAILQRGDDLELLPAGQHYITNPNVTLRGLYTLGENQLEMPTKDM